MGKLRAPRNFAENQANGVNPHDEMLPQESARIIIGHVADGDAILQRYRVPAAVELTEMLGDNTNVYVDIADKKAILKVDPHDTPDIDSEIVFSIPFESVYLFDGETERRI